MVTFIDQLFGDCTFQIIMLKLGSSKENIFGRKVEKVDNKNNIETQINRINKTEGVVLGRT